MLIDNTDFLKFPLFKKGKIRNIYDMGDALLIIVTDRVSAFDVVFNDLIPDKGKVINLISEFFFNLTGDIVDNHMITTDISQFPGIFPEYAEQLSGRSMVVKKAEMINVECIVRGYLEGSALKEYERTGMVSGIKLPGNLKQCEKLEEPLFTPSTKEEEGHDINISFEDSVNKIGKELSEKLRDTSLALYMKVSAYAESKGLILADTKFEFGIIDNRLVLADEIFTPDSSRYWEKAEYCSGRPQKSFDKQFLREFLEQGKWDKRPPAPRLPVEIITKTREKYIEAYERITGKQFKERK
jgi:phosphoribosylaminoimidazole-succinocarboxamide synthase